MASFTRGPSKRVYSMGLMMTSHLCTPKGGKEVECWSHTHEIHQSFTDIVRFPPVLSSHPPVKPQISDDHGTDTDMTESIGLWDLGNRGVMGGE